MASTFVLNLVIRTVAVAYATFVHVPEKWQGPKELTRGSKKMIELLKTVTGTHVKPVFPVYLLNEDCSSQYYFSGSIKSDSANNGWS